MTKIQHSTSFSPITNNVSLSNHHKKPHLELLEFLKAIVIGNYDPKELMWLLQESTSSCSGQHKPYKTKFLVSIQEALKTTML